MPGQLKRSGRLLVKYLKPQWISVLLLAILLLSNIGLQLVNPQIIRYFIDTTQAGGAAQKLLIAALLFIGFALLQRVVAFGATYLAQHISWTSTNTLRADLALHCLRLDMSFHKKYRPGELIERIDGDMNALTNFFSQFSIQILGNALLILGILLLLWRENWLVGIGLTVYSLLTMLILVLLQQTGVKKWGRERQAAADHYGFLEEHLAGTEDIRACGAEAYVTQRLYLLMRRMLVTYRAAMLLSDLTFLATRFLFVIGYVLGLGIAAYLFLQHQATIGTAYLVVYYIGMLATPLQGIQLQVTDLQQATASIERVEELLSLRPDIQEKAQASLPDGPLAVELREVSFSYDHEQAVLQDISFSLPPGRILGVLGRTGSGKTTLARLLFRLYDPVGGQICLNGNDLRDLALTDVRARVGMVTQDVQLFQASIRANLTFFQQDITDDRLLGVLTELGLGEWLQAQPRGLDTELAAGGQGLSAGEAQLLALARVFLKNPGLVILDEASARLDPATEHLLEQAIERLLAQRTGIIIAHRLKTVLRADDILILENGRIVEYGPRETLLNDHTSRFSILLQTGFEEVFA